MSNRSSPPRAHQGPGPDPDPWADEGEPDCFKPLTREEARQWRARQPETSVWQVVRWQLLLTVGVTLVAAAVAPRSSVVWSVLYGALCVLLPTSLMAHGLTSSLLFRRLGMGRASATNASLGRLFFWEGVKVALVLAMMWVAPRLIPDLSWLGLLAGLVVVLKAYWLALWRARRWRR
jgi:ATP synthase protein I